MFVVLLLFFFLGFFIDIFIEEPFVFWDNKLSLCFFVADDGLWVSLSFVSVEIVAFLMFLVLLFFFFLFFVTFCFLRSFFDNELLLVFEIIVVVLVFEVSSVDTSIFVEVGASNVLFLLSGRSFSLLVFVGIFSFFASNFRITHCLFGLV